MLWAPGVAGGGLELPLGPGLEEEEDVAGRRDLPEVSGREEGCLFLSCDPGTGETRGQTSLIPEPSPWSQGPQNLPKGEGQGRGSSFNRGPFLWLPAWCPCPHCMC